MSQSQNQSLAMKHKNNQPQSSKTQHVLPLAKAWWKRHPQANLLDIESAIEKMTKTPGNNVPPSNKPRKGFFRH